MRHIILSLFLFAFNCSSGAGERSILVLGDSLSAGYGIAIENSWVSRLQERLDEQGYIYRVINASISGETTRGVRARLDDILANTGADITVIELGGNDGLRGLSLEEIESNMAAIIASLCAIGSRILLVQMLLPPNYGTAYIERFTGIYNRLAEAENVHLARFILAGIADRPELMQPDGIHPTADAQGMMLDNIWPDLEPLLEKDKDE